MTLNNVRPIGLTLPSFKPAPSNQTQTHASFPSKASGDSYGGVTFGGRHRSPDPYTKQYRHIENDKYRPHNLSGRGMAILVGIGLMVHSVVGLFTMSSSDSASESRNRETSHSERKSYRPHRSHRSHKRPRHRN